MAELLGAGLLFVVSGTRKWLEGKIEDAVDLKDLQDFLSDQMKTIEEGIAILRVRPLKTATNHHRLGMKLYILNVKKQKATDKLSWQYYLRLANENAHEAIDQVETPEQEIQCFFIICSCISALHENNPQDGMIAIQQAIKIILEKESIQQALRKLNKCTTPKNPSSLTIATKDLLVNLFRNLNSALEVFHKFGTTLSKEEFLEQKKEMRDIFRMKFSLKTKTSTKSYLCESTDPNAIPWSEIMVYCKPPFLMGLFQNPQKIPWEQESMIVANRWYPMILDYCQCDYQDNYSPGKVEIRTSDDGIREVHPIQQDIFIAKRNIRIQWNEQEEQENKIVEVFSTGAYQTYFMMKSWLKSALEEVPAFVYMGLIMLVLLLYYSSNLVIHDPIQQPEQEKSWLEKIDEFL